MNKNIREWNRTSKKEKLKTKENKESIGTNNNGNVIRHHIEMHPFFIATLEASANGVTVFKKILKHTIFVFGVSISLQILFYSLGFISLFVQKFRTQYQPIVPEYVEKKYLNDWPDPKVARKNGWIYSSWPTDGCADRLVVTITKTQCNNQQTNTNKYYKEVNIRPAYNELHLILHI